MKTPAIFHDCRGSYLSVSQTYFLPKRTADPLRAILSSVHGVSPAGWPDGHDRVESLEQFAHVQQREQGHEAGQHGIDDSRGLATVHHQKDADDRHKVGQADHEGHHAHRSGARLGGDALSPEGGKCIGEGLCQETQDGEDPEEDDSVFLFHSFTVLRYTTAKLRSFPFARNPHLWRFIM